MTPIHLATLKHVAWMCEKRRADGRRQSVDLRTIGEPMRQRIIDLAMMEPPLVDCDGDQVFLTGRGYVALEQ